MRLHQALNAAAAELSHQEPLRPEDRQLTCEALARLAGELAPAFAAADLTPERLAEHAALMPAGLIRPAELVAAALAAAAECAAYEATQPGGRGTAPNIETTT